MSLCKIQYIFVFSSSTDQKPYLENYTPLHTRLAIFTSAPCGSTANDQTISNLLTLRRGASERRRQNVGCWKGPIKAEVKSASFPAGGPIPEDLNPPGEGSSPCCSSSTFTSSRILLDHFRILFVRAETRVRRTRGIFEGGTVWSGTLLRFISLAICSANYISSNFG